MLCHAHECARQQSCRKTAIPNIFVPIIRRHQTTLQSTDRELTPFRFVWLTIWMRRLANTFDDIVKRLGGVEATARLLNRSTQAVFNGRSRGQIPAALWPDITEELAERGYECEALWLFSFENNRRSAKRHAA